VDYQNHQKQGPLVMSLEKRIEQAVEAIYSNPNHWSELILAQLLDEAKRRIEWQSQVIVDFQTPTPNE